MNKFSRFANFLQSNSLVETFRTKCNPSSWANEPGSSFISISCNFVKLLFDLYLFICIISIYIYICS